MTHSRAVARLPAWSFLVGVALLASSCAHGLAFSQDRRLTIIAPRGHGKVRLPFTVRWTMRDFRVTGPDGGSDPDSGYFAVFLDRTPIPPGKPLSWIARDDRRCKLIPGCPDETYFETRHVYATTQTQLSFGLLPDLQAVGGHETHEVTIVLLDGSGRRIGENAWYASFRYDRKKTA